MARLIKLLKQAGRFLPASLVPAALLFSMIPAVPAAADDPKPLELKLDAAGKIPIYANNIKPGDKGTKTVTFQNTGTRDGFLSIFVTDVTSTEGNNPKWGTGNPSAPGNLGDYLTLDFSADGLETNLTLPLPVSQLPVTPTETKYIRIDPVKSGETKTLDIHWELPASTGNLVQGNTLSFTLNYMLRGAKTIDVSDNATEGEVLEDIIIYSQNEHGNIKITANVTAKTADNQTPIDIWLVEVDNSTPPDPPGFKAFAGLYYEGGPDGLVFSSPITITLAYDPANIPAGVSELDVYIALWDTTLQQWVPLPNCVVDTVAKTVSAQISHFSHYTVLTPTLPVSPPPPVPPLVPPVTPPVTPEEPPDPEKEPATLEVTVFEDESFVYVDDDGTLERSLYLQDEDGTIVIEVQAGTKVTDAEGNPLSRIELTLVEVEVELPDGTVVLTPGYKLTGYDQNRVETDIVFSPGAAISIRYNPNDLPDNSFLPFVAFYSPETGLIQLPLPDGFLVGVGWAQGLMTSGGIFLAAVEEAPAPPPLPANFRASNLVIDPGETFEGNPVRISVTISNEGELPGTAELYLLIDGIVRAIQEVALDGKTSEILTFEISNLAAGLHHIEIARLEGTVRVDREGLNPLGPAMDWRIVDYCVAGAVALGLFIWFILARRNRRREKENREYQVVYGNNTPVE